MKPSMIKQVPFKIIAILVASTCINACAGKVANKPDVYKAEKVRIERQNYALNPVLVKPVSPKGAADLIVFASGDGGLMGLSKTILQHLADSGHYVAGFSSREALGSFKGSSERVSYDQALDDVSWMTSEAKTQLGLRPDTPIIVTGLSRGANFVVLSASSNQMNDVVGAVAIALTKEFDNISVSAEHLAKPGMKVDEQQRLQTYPAIEHIGMIPFAVIQSTNDSYIPSAESRKLLGPDTATRRLYEVKSDGHNFGGGEDQMLRDLDDALSWIENSK